MTKDDRPFMKPRELAEEYGVSRSTVWRWQEKRILDVKRLGPRLGVRVRLKRRYDDRATEFDD